MIEINQLNKIMCQLKCDNEEQLRDIYNFFRIEDPGLKYTPAVRAGMSDGKRSFVSTNGQFLFGLKWKIIKFIESKGWEYKDNVLSIQQKIQDEEWIHFITSLNLPFDPYDYQMNGARIAIEEKRRILLASTSAGKSLMLYIMIRWFIHKEEPVLIVVPSVDLVNQLYSDFEEYANLLEHRLREERPKAEELRQYEIDSKLEEIKKNNIEFGFDQPFDEYFHKIFSGQDKTRETLVCISTFQSIYDIGETGFFMRYNVMLADECLHPDTLVTCKDGVKKICEMTTNDVVLTINEQTNEYEYNNVEKIHKNISSEPCYDIEFEDGSIITITGNHKVLTQRGWVRADNLSNDDEIISLLTK